MKTNPKFQTSRIWYHSRYLEKGGSKSCFRLYKNVKNNYMLNFENWTVIQVVHFKVKWIKNCHRIYVITRPKQRLWPVQCTLHSHRIIILSRCRGWWRNRLWQKLRFMWGFSPRWRLRCRCRRRKILSQVQVRSQVQVSIHQNSDSP